MNTFTMKKIRPADVSAFMLAINELFRDAHDDRPEDFHEAIMWAHHINLISSAEKQHLTSVFT